MKIGVIGSVEWEAISEACWRARARTSISWLAQAFASARRKDCKCFPAGQLPCAHPRYHRAPQIVRWTGLVLCEILRYLSCHREMESMWMIPRYPQPANGIDNLENWSITMDPSGSWRDRIHRIIPGCTWCYRSHRDLGRIVFANSMARRASGSIDP